MTLPNVPHPPKGYEQIFKGKVRSSDMVYAPHDPDGNHWGHPTKTDYNCLGSDVEVYYGVARKIQKRRKK